MDFCDLDTPWGHVSRARAVLDFVGKTLSLSSFHDSQIEMNGEQCDGLMWILAACSETLKKAEEEAEKQGDEAQRLCCNGNEEHPKSGNVHYL